MSLELKYVVTNKGDFAIFTALTNHNDVGFKLYGLPVGAGFCHFDDGEIQCYGESISMDLKSRGDVDAEIINDRL